MPHTPKLPGQPLAHNPEFEMDRSIDNGGCFRGDGTVERPELEASRGETFRDPDAFPFTD